MARVKPKRQGIHIDMTAMSDMAWLLLTFFILTTQFRDPETIEVVTPSSIADEKLSDGNVFRISIDEKGHFFFSLSDEATRVKTLEAMGEEKNVSFTDKEKNDFRITQDVGVPLSGVKSFLSLSDSDKEKYMASSNGVPLDSTNFELIDWILKAQKVDEDIKLAIRGDVKTQYPQFKLLIDELQNKGINKFQLITSSEETPK